MSEFHKYHKILSKKGVDPQTPACWSEKIHGANMRIRIDTKGKITYGSRNQELVTTSGNFMGVDLDKVMCDIEMWASLLHANVPEEVYVFGEFFGGNIQKEVIYGNSKYFRAFDIRINDTYISSHKFEDLCDKCGIPHIEMHYGTWEECMAVEIEGVNSPIAINLSGIENEWEGIVVRAVEDTHCECKRKIVKRKTKQFSEVMRGATKKKIRVLKPTADESIVSEVMLYITRNRLINILSHDDVDTSNQLRLAGMLATDALEEYILTEELTLTTQEKKRIKKEISGAAKKIVTDYE